MAVANKAKSLLIGGALIAGIGVGAYYLLNRNSTTATDNSDAFSNGAVFDDTSGGSSAMQNTGTGILSDVLNSIFSAQSAATAETNANNLSDLMSMQPSDENSDAVQLTAQTALYGDKYEQALQVMDSYITNNESVQTSDANGNLTTVRLGGTWQDAVKSGDYTRINAYSSAAQQVAKKVYGEDYYNSLTASQQSALITNIVHGKIDTADSSALTLAGYNVSEMTDADTYSTLLNETMQSTATASSSTASYGSSGSTRTYSSESAADKIYSEKKSTASQVKSATSSRLGSSSDSAAHYKATGKYGH